MALDPGFILYLVPDFGFHPADFEGRCGPQGTPTLWHSAPISCTTLTDTYADSAAVSCMDRFESYDRHHVRRDEESRFGMSAESVGGHTGSVIRSRYRSSQAYVVQEPLYGWIARMDDASNGLVGATSNEIVAMETMINDEKMIPVINTSHTSIHLNTPQYTSISVLKSTSGSPEVGVMAAEVPPVEQGLRPAGQGHVQVRF